MFLETSDTTVIGSYIAGIVGVASAIAALYKVKPDANRTTVSAAEGAVIVQTSVIKNLNEEIVRLRDLHKNCESDAKQARADSQAEIKKIKDECEARTNHLHDVIETISERKKLRRSSDGEQE